MIVPNLADVARATFESFPEDVKTLRQVCDETDALRARVGPDDPRVQAGEVRANNLKGLFTRRIAWACHSLHAGFGLRRKTIGQRATRPADGAEHSTDALMWRATGNIVDVMSDRNWSWLQNDADTQPFDQWLEPLAEAGISLPDVPDVPPAPGGDAELRARVQSLEATSNAQAALIREVLDRLAAVVEDRRVIFDRLTMGLERVDKLEKFILELPESTLPALVADGVVALPFGLTKHVVIPVRLARGGDPK